MPRRKVVIDSNDNSGFDSINYIVIDERRTHCSLACDNGVSEYV